MLYLSRAPSQSFYLFRKNRKWNNSRNQILFTLAVCILYVSFFWSLDSLHILKIGAAPSQACGCQRLNNYYILAYASDTYLTYPEIMSGLVPIKVYKDLMKHEEFREELHRIGGVYGFINMAEGNI